MKDDKLFSVKRRLFYEGFMENNHVLVRETLKAYPELLNESIETVDPEDADYDTNDGATPLLTAISFSDYEMFKMLVKDFHVDVNKGNYEGITALWKLSSIDDKEKIFWVDLLVENGVDIHTKTYEGMTPLMLAGKTGYIEMVEKLLKLGVDVSAVNTSQSNVLHWMGMSYDGIKDEVIIDKIIRTILDYGINIHAKVYTEETALDLSRRYHRVLVEKVLKKYMNLYPKNEESTPINNNTIPDDFMK